MINIKPFLENSQQNKLEYFNAIGLIFQDHIYLNRNDVLVHYEIADIKRVCFKKQRSLKYNFLSLVLSVLIGLASYALLNVLGSFSLVGFIISGCFLLYSFLKKSYSHTIVMFTVNQNIVSLVINPDCKEQATKLVALINTKIKNESRYLKVS